MAGMDSDPNDPLEWENWTGDLPFWQHAFCGSIAGVMEHVSLFPLDTIKTRLQTDSQASLGRSRPWPGASDANRPGREPGKASLKPNGRLSRDSSFKMDSKWAARLSRDLSGRLSRVVRSARRDIATGAIKGAPDINLSAAPSRDVTGGILRSLEARGALGRGLNGGGFYSNLFRGSNVIVAGCVPAHVLYFTVYEKIKRAGNVALSGASATLCHDLVLTPADVVKQRLQLGCYRSSCDCFFNILRQEGVRALFRSLHITLLMNVPYHSLLVSIIHLLKPRGQEKIDNYKHFVYAGFGGAVAGALTTPFDVIKTRLQTQTCQMDAKRPKLRLKYRNVMETFRNILRREGARGFMRGVSTRVMMCTPSAAISWGTYETLKNLIKLIN